jgi:hypothetical protein
MNNVFHSEYKIVMEIHLNVLRTWLSTWEKNQKFQGHWEKYVSLLFYEVLW